MVIEKVFESLINADNEVIEEITGFKAEKGSSHSAKKKPSSGHSSGGHSESHSSGHGGGGHGGGGGHH